MQPVDRSRRQEHEQKLWTGAYYLNYLEPETKRALRPDLRLSVDGQWITISHGLASALPADRVKTTLATIKRANIAVTKYGAVNYVATRQTGQCGRIRNLFLLPARSPDACHDLHLLWRKGIRRGMARRVWHNLVCIQGYTWDMPNIMRGDVDTGERIFGNDYYQDLMLWSLPAAFAGQVFPPPPKRMGLFNE